MPAGNEIYTMLIEAKDSLNQSYKYNIRKMLNDHRVPEEAVQKLRDERDHVIAELDKRIDIYRPKTPQK